MANRQMVPGDSPAYYVGDPTNDKLSINALDLIPNPPVDYMTLRLRGDIKSDIGSAPRIKVGVALNGHPGPGFESELCYQKRKIKIRQNGTDSCPPKEGPVELSYYVGIPRIWLKKGNYTVRVEMYDTDMSRMAGFEGTVWIDGAKGDGKGGWWTADEM